MAIVLVTGATGFVGKALIQGLLANGLYSLVAVSRRQMVDLPIEVKSVLVADIAQETDWSSTLKDVDAVVHTAARAHVIKDKATDPLAECRRVNTEGTLTLARQAAEAGVRRFIFISSIGVNGNRNTRPFTEKDTPHPAEPYAVSKLEAEQGLCQLASETDMEVVIIRPPLLYGPNAPGNFGNLMRWVNKGIPLPLGTIHNRRSLVALDNLVDFILTCIDHPAAANQTFLVADGEDLSTTELLRRMATALGRPGLLLPIPQNILKACLKIIGKGDMARRLCGSLQVDISKARVLLGWNPPISLDEGLRRTAQGFSHEKAKGVDHFYS